MANPSMNTDQIEELRCLRSSNDATQKPAAIHRHHWSAGIRYDTICAAGYARKYSRQPKGFSNAFFGVKITDKGRAFLDSRSTT